MHKSGHFSVTKIIFNTAEKITIHLCILPFDNFGKEEKLLAICKILWYTIKVLWGCSSLGRALEWHSRGSRFDPDHLHQKKSTTSVVLFCFIRQGRFGLTLLPLSGVSLVFAGIAVSVLEGSAPEYAPLIQSTIAAAAVINEIIAVFMAKKGFEWAGELGQAGKYAASAETADAR